MNVALSAPHDKCYEWRVSTERGQNLVLQRVKNQQIQSYQLSLTSIKCAQSHVYTLIPENNGKEKVLKYPTTDTLQSEYEIIKYLHASNSNPTGIIKLPKAFVTTVVNGKPFKVMVLPKYNSHMEFWLVNTTNSPQEILKAIIQISKGMKYLLSKHIFHGDFRLENILVGTWKGQKRFDIIDFGLSKRMDQMTTKEHFIDYFRSVWGFNKFRNDIESLNSLEEEDAVKMGRKILFEHSVLTLAETIIDCLAYGRTSFSVPNPTFMHVKEIVMHIMDTRCLDNAIENLEKLYSDHFG
jgi:serine/threonine protein kinase